VRVYDTLDQGGGDGGVDSVAAALENPRASGCGKIMFCG